MTDYAGTANEIADTGAPAGSLVESALDSFQIEWLKSLSGPLSSVMKAAETALSSLHGIYASAAGSQQKALEPVLKATEETAASLKAVCSSEHISPEKHAIAEANLQALKELAETAERMNSNNNTTLIISVIAVVTVFIAAASLLLLCMKNK